MNKKFRAWDKVHNEMYNWETIKSEFVMRDFENDSLVMMQWTGLKDVYGREIYDGDILEVTPENRNHYPEKSVFFVIPSKTLWGYDFHWEHVSGYECSTHIVEIDDNYEKLLNVEVIGNIYKKPELLEVTE